MGRIGNREALWVIVGKVVQLILVGSLAAMQL